MLDSSDSESDTASRWGCSHRDSMRTTRPNKEGVKSGQSTVRTQRYAGYFMGSFFIAYSEVQRSSILSVTHYKLLITYMSRTCLLNFLKLNLNDSQLYKNICTNNNLNQVTCSFLKSAYLFNENSGRTANFCGVHFL